VRDRLRNEGVDDELGGVNRFTMVADVVDNLNRAAEPVAQPAKPVG
jgi:hypothetical protein